MKSKFKNESCAYWRFRRIIVAITIAQILVVLAGAAVSFVTCLDALDIISLTSIPFFALVYAREYYLSLMKNGEGN